MKRTTALYAVTALAALSFASQALAKGGSMGGGQGHGTAGGASQMTTTMQSAAGNGMKQGTMPGNGSQGSLAGSGSQHMKRGGSGNSVGYQPGQMNGNAVAPTTQQPPVTTTAN